MRKPASGSRMCPTSEVRTLPPFPKTTTFLPSYKLRELLQRALRLTTAFAPRNLTPKVRVVWPSLHTLAIEPETRVAENRLDGADSIALDQLNTVAHEVMHFVLDLLVEDEA